MTTFWLGLAAVTRKTTLRFRSQLAQHPDREAISIFLASRPTHFVTDRAFHVHGSPRDHLHEYLFPEDIHNEGKMNEVMSLVETLCFCGHTHVPGMFHRNSGGWGFTNPEDSDYQFLVTSEKAICNVGSVGQPRDGDARACYVLFNRDTITFRRVAYDIDRTIQKMRDEGDEA